MSNVVLIPATELRDGVTFYRIQVAEVVYPAGSAAGGVLRRYSEVSKLHSDLAAAYPVHRHVLDTAGLPGRSLFKNSTAVVAARQRSLAQYLTTLVSTPPFATSPQLAEFLGLDVATLTQLQRGGAGPHGRRTSNGGALTGPASWLERLQHAQGRIVDLRKACIERDSLLAAGDSMRAQRVASHAAVEADELLIELGQLEAGLSEATAAGAPGPGGISPKERVRRSNLLLSARQEVIAVQQRLNVTSSLFGNASAASTTAAPSTPARSDHPPRRTVGRPTGSAGIPGAFPGAAPGAYASSPRVDLAGATNSDLVQLQHATMAEQDSVIQEIGAVVGRLKQIGTTMNDELEAQNQMIDETRDEVDRVAGRVQAANRKTRRMLK
ncbi:hypothetical protein H9P43_004253 [Blastocladiella emersonii ATCC 22665]|nr:hypothetical protein H9P43_004253 [Blastocladiella emersonii ATCC 22665]